MLLTVFKCNHKFLQRITHFYIQSFYKNAANVIWKTFKKLSSYIRFWNAFLKIFKQFLKWSLKSPKFHIMSPAVNKNIEPFNIQNSSTWNSHTKVLRNTSYGNTPLNIISKITSGFDNSFLLNNIFRRILPPMILSI